MQGFILFDKCFDLLQGKGRSSGNHFVEDNPKGIYVRSHGQFFLPKELGRDIEIFIRDEKLYLERQDPWKIFEEFLLKYEPAIGSTHETQLSIKREILDRDEIKIVWRREVEFLTAIKFDVV